MPKNKKNNRSLSALIGASMLVVAAGKYFFSVVLSEKLSKEKKDTEENQ